MGDVLIAIQDAISNVRDGMEALDAIEQVRLILAEAGYDSTTNLGDIPYSMVECLSCGFVHTSGNECAKCGL